MNIVVPQTPPVQPCHTTRTYTRRKWLPNEDDYLRQQIRSYQASGKPVEWTKVAIGLKDRNNKDCRKRWLKIDDRWGQGSWSPDEDERLRRAVREFFTRWKAVSDYVKTRSPDQCAKRWKNSLDPTLLRSDWSTAEDEVLVAAVDRLGRNWKSISEGHFPARSRLDLSNRYTLLTRKQRIEYIARKPKIEQLTEKQESLAAQFEELYPIQSHEVTGEMISSRPNESYEWATSVSPVPSIMCSTPSMSSHSGADSPRLSLSSTSSIEEISRSSWDEVVDNSNGMTASSMAMAVGYVVNEQSQHHQQHSRLLTTSPVFQHQARQSYMPVSQGWADSKSSVSPHVGFGMAQILPLPSVYQNVVDGHVQQPQTPTHHRSTSVTVSSSHGFTHSPSLVENPARRSPSMSPSGTPTINVPLQVDPSTGSAMVFNALNQGTQVTLVFH